MDRFLTIGFLSKLSLKKKNKNKHDTKKDENDNSIISNAKNHLRNFIEKE